MPHKRRSRNTGSLYRRGRTWWVKFYSRGRVFRQSSHSDKREDADRLLARLRGEAATGKFRGFGPERIRVEHLLDELVDDYKREGRRNIDSHLKHLRAAFSGVRAADFGTIEVKRYVAQRREAGAAIGTINTELSLLKRAFNLAAKSDPPRIARVPYIRLLPGARIRSGFLEHDAYVRLRDELADHLRALYVVAYYTGARRGELLSLRREQVDLAGARITLERGQTKTREARSLPIYSEMKHWLSMALDKDHRCPLVFHRDGRRIGNFHAIWKAACKRAGLPDLVFHDLRRSAVRNMVRAGIPERVAMSISGHKTRAVFDRYNITSARDISKVGLAMERYFGGETASSTSTSTEIRHNLGHKKELSN